MRALGRTAFVLFPLLAAGVAGAQDKIVLADHHMLHGKVTATTADSVTFVQTVDGKESTSVLHADDIDPHSFYIARSHALSDKDAQGHADLGKYGQAHGLFTRARNEFHTAAKIDPSMASKMEELHDQSVDGSAEQMLAKAKAAQASGDLDEANRQSLAVIRHYPDTPSADAARKLNDQIHQQKRTQAKEAAAAKVQKTVSDAVKKAQKRIQSAQDENRKGLGEKQFSGALRFFGESVGHYSAALVDLTGADSSDPSVAALIAQTKKEAIGVHINAGSIYLTRSDYQGALKEANAALAIDQKSSQAQAFRARVSSASAESDIDVGIGPRVFRRR